MNDADRSELAQLKEHQRSLELQLKSATAQLEELRARIDQFAGQTKSAAVLDTAEVKPPEVAPVPTSETDQTLAVLLSVREKIQTAQPPLIPPIIPTAVVPVSTSQAVAPLAEEPAVKAPEIVPGSSSQVVLPPLTGPPPPAAPEPSFEMRIGKFWLVRVGIVMLLTTLVLLANLAYQKWIPKLGPAGKVALPNSSLPHATTVPSLLNARQW